MTTAQTIAIENFTPSLTLGEIQKNYGISWMETNYIDLERGKIEMWRIDFDLKSNYYDIRRFASDFNVGIINQIHFQEGVASTRAEDGFHGEIEDLQRLRNNAGAAKRHAKKRLDEAIQLRKRLLKFKKRVEGTN